MVITPKIAIVALTTLAISSGVGFGFSELEKRNANFRKLVKNIEERIGRFRVNDSKSCIEAAISYFTGDEAYKAAFRKCAESISFEKRFNKYTTSTGTSNSAPNNWSTEKTNVEVQGSKAAQKLKEEGKNISNLDNSTDFCNKIKELSNKDFDSNGALEREWEIYLRVCKGDAHKNKKYW